MARFHTGYYSTDLRGASSFYRGAGFSFEKEPGRFPGMPTNFKRHEKRLRRLRGRPPVTTYSASDEDAWFDGEIMIRARSHASAKRAFNLFVASIAVSDGEIRWLRHPLEIENLAKEGHPEHREFLTSRHGLTDACALAARTSRRRSSTYAIFKLHLSYGSCSTGAMDLQPSPYKLFPVETDAIAHVHVANAIALAYSAIEELGLEVRVKKDQPSRMPDGTWNPHVKADLERRLLAAHIDLSDTHIWTLRGPPTRIEKGRRPKGTGKPKWARGSVRDIRLPIIDALAMASWLRSKVSTHRFSREARSLTAYDAHNVQSLARRLILEKYRLLPFRGSAQSLAPTPPAR
jgi:hypothetical protein